MAASSLAPAESYPVAHLGRVDSTNSEALRRHAAGMTGPFWVMAKRQASGRGRAGRQWVSEAGNLYASLLLPLDRPLAQAASLGLVVAVALCDAVEAAAREMRLEMPRPRVKWPNDVLVEGAKISGILLETVPGGAGADAVVIGMGVNCAHAPDLPDRRTAALADFGLDVAPEGLGRHLFRAVETRIAAWQVDGFSAVRQDWLDRAVGLGGPVTVRLPRETFSGTFEALDCEGRLLARLADGTRRKVAAGDVFFGLEAGAASA